VSALLPIQYLLRGNCGARRYPPGSCRFCPCDFFSLQVLPSGQDRTVIPGPATQVQRNLTASFFRPFSFSLPFATDILSSTERLFLEKLRFTWIALLFPFQIDVDARCPRIIDPSSLQRRGVFFPKVPKSLPAPWVVFPFSAARFLVGTSSLLIPLIPFRLRFILAKNRPWRPSNDTLPVPTFSSTLCRQNFPFFTMPRLPFRQGSQGFASQFSDRCAQMGASCSFSEKLEFAPIPDQRGILVFFLLQPPPRGCSPSSEACVFPKLISLNLPHPTFRSSAFVHTRVSTKNYLFSSLHRTYTPLPFFFVQPPFGPFN